MNRFRSLWNAMLSSLWLTPVLMLCASVVAAVGLVELQAGIDVDLVERWPRLLGAGAAGARGMLSAIATSMITVAGVVFSITVVALSLAASQYSPRLLRHFMSDRPTQAVLGAFVSIFAYCLVVLRTIRGGDEGGFVPSLAVLVGVGLAFAGVLLLIYFVHHVASSIQVTSILERIAGETNPALARLFPDRLGTGVDPQECPEPVGAVDAFGGVRAVEVPSARTGYLVRIDSDALLSWAQQHDAVVEVLPRVGDFVVVDLPMLRIGYRRVAGTRLDDAAVGALRACFEIGRQRTVQQDALFGLQQIVDVALKALSPGINDPSTATACVDHLGALLAAVAPRRMPSPCRATGGVVRVVVRGVAFESMLALAFDALSEHAGTHLEVHERMAEAIGQIATATSAADRHEALAHQLDVVAACAGRAGVPPHRRARFEALLEAQRARIRGLSAALAPQPG